MPLLCALILAASASASAHAAPAPAPQVLDLERQVGQLFMVAIDTESAARYENDIRAGRLGAAMLRWDRFTGEQARDFAEQMAVWTSTNTPFLLGTDHEGGTLFTQRLYGATIFPGNMALGAAGSPALAERAALASGLELRALGVRLNFAPTVDVNADPGNPIIGVRSFGEDPAAVARLGAAAVRGYARANVAAAAKHFPGHGDTTVDSHLGMPVSTRTAAGLRAIDLLPFKAAIAAGVPIVMPAHMVFPALGDAQLPVTLSSTVLQGVLRRELGFQGVIISDSLDMGAITKLWGTPEASVLAFEAGCDILLTGKGDFPGAYAALLEAVRSGRISTKRLDASVRRVLALKRRLGLMKNRHPDRPLTFRRLPESLALAQEIAERSVTLLRADPAVLPLRPGAKLLVVISHSPSFPAEARNFFELIRARAPAAEFIGLGPRPTPDEIRAARARADGADAVVFASWFWSTLGVEQTALGKSLEASGKPVAHVAMLNPYGLGAFPEARGAVALYGVAPASLEAGARLLFGEIPPRGKLPVTIPGFAKRGDGLQAFAKSVQPATRNASDGQKR